MCYKMHQREQKCLNFNLCISVMKNHDLSVIYQISHISNFTILSTNSCMLVLFPHYPDNIVYFDTEQENAIYTNAITPAIIDEEYSQLPLLNKFQLEERQEDEPTRRISMAPRMYMAPAKVVPR